MRYSELLNKLTIAEECKTHSKRELDTTKANILINTNWNEINEERKQKERPNFKFVEEEELDWEQFKEEYKKGISQMALSEKYGMNIRKIRRLFYQAEEETGIIRTRRKDKSKRIPNFFYWDNYRGLFQVKKTINGKTIYYGAFKHINDAKKCVELLKECNWNKDEMWRIKDQINQEKVYAS